MNKLKLAIVSLLVLALVFFAWSSFNPVANAVESEGFNLDLSEIQAIAEEAYIYGYPMVDNYRNIHSFSMDEDDFNVITHDRELYTPQNQQVVTPNTDTLYSRLSLDLRAEPIVVVLPPLDPYTNEKEEIERYYSIQLIDLYTHNFDYIGTRTTGNEGGTFMIAGPSWNGQIPKGIDQVFPCESEIALALYRTQVFNPDDIETVHNSPTVTASGVRLFIENPPKF